MDEDEIEQSRRRVQEIYGCFLEDVPVVYERKGLALWEGGCTWIDEEKGTAFIQIAPIFAKRKRWWRYEREEILTHEFVHAARAGLPPSRFEEYFAYRLSSSSFRRYCGPLLSHPWLGGWLGMLAVSLFLALGGTYWPLAVSWAGLLAALLWHELHRRILRRCARYLSQGGEECEVWARMFHATDAQLKDWANQKRSSPF